MRTILVIDDDPELRDVLSLILDASGYQVTTAADGEEGLRRMAAEPPGLVLCDLDMPRVDGIAVAGAMARDPRLRAIPLVIMSALPMGRVAPVASAVAMLAKPFLSKTLLALVQRFMPPDPAASMEKAAVGGGRMVSEPSY